MATLSATVDLPVTAFTVRDARTLTLTVVASWASAVSREDLSLLVDDLTTDVVDHAGDESSLVLELTLADELLRVGLTDGSAVRPVAEDVTRVGPSWALAHRWGDEPHRGGHRVWFELRPPREPVGGADPDPDHDGRTGGAVGTADIAAVLATIDAESAVIASGRSQEDDADPERHEPGRP